MRPGLIGVVEDWREMIREGVLFFSGNYLILKNNYNEVEIKSLFCFVSLIAMKSDGYPL